MRAWLVMASEVMERLMQETTASFLSSQVRQQNTLLLNHFTVSKTTVLLPPMCLLDCSHTACLGTRRA